MKLFRVKMLHTFDQLFAGQSYNLTRDHADTLIACGAAEREGPQWENVAPAPVAPPAVIAPSAPVAPEPNVAALAEPEKEKAPAKKVLHMPKRAATKHSPKAAPKRRAK